MTRSRGRRRSGKGCASASQTSGTPTPPTTPSSAGSQGTSIGVREKPDRHQWVARRSRARCGPGNRAHAPVSHSGRRDDVARTDQERRRGACGSPASSGTRALGPRSAGCSRRTGLARPHWERHTGLASSSSSPTPAPGTPSSRRCPCSSTARFTSRRAPTSAAPSSCRLPIAGWSQFLELAPDSGLKFGELAQAGEYWWGRKIPRDLPDGTLGQWRPK